MVGVGGAAMSAILPAVSTKPDIQVALKAACYKSDQTYAPREWVIKNLVGLQMLNVWIGPEKSRKSSFAMRFFMHVACGNSFDGFSVPRPRGVVYLSAEDPGIDLDVRYRAMLEEFTPSEQALIEKNFQLIKGRDEFISKGINIEHTNREFWRELPKMYPAEVYVLDALEMFCSGRTNESMRDALISLRNYCGPNNCLVILHHTRKRSEYETTKHKPILLRNIGVRVWSDKCLGAGAIKRIADTIMCQEYWEEKDTDGFIVDASTDLAAFGKSIEDIPLLTFKDEGVYRYKLVRDLGTGASESLRTLREARGPWPSRNAAAKTLKLSRSQANLHVRELLQKGWLHANDDGSISLG